MTSPSGPSSTPEPQPRAPRSRSGRPVDQARAAEAFLAAPKHLEMHDRRLWDLRERRDREMRDHDDWEALRERASAVKEHTLARLDDYLEQFEAAATANGVQVHWARDAAEHNTVVADLLAARSVRRLIKSKSMLTEECGLRPYLEARGVEVVETDLGERIQQLDGEDPSHVVVPAVHKLKSDVAQIFAATIGTDPANDDVHYLASAQREATRPLILNAEAGMTGANFLVAETGAVVVCTNEGMRICARACPRSTSSRRGSRRSCRDSPTLPCSSASCRGARSARPSRNTRPTSADLARAGRCTSCLSTTVAARGSGCPSSGRR